MWNGMGIMEVLSYHVQGGLGAIPEWEGFGPDYYLPNETGVARVSSIVNRTHL